jgi:NADH:ubiquinone oxidoreductase subunit 2 (subunit N)
MAGVPPFIGFFSKLFILNILVNSNFFIFYFFLFVLLLTGLYFYMQNLRFLHTSNHGFNDKHFLFIERTPLAFFYFAIFTSLVLVFGFIYVDDLLLAFSWLFI